MLGLMFVLLFACTFRCPLSPDAMGRSALTMTLGVPMAGLLHVWWERQNHRFDLRNPLWQFAIAVAFVLTFGFVVPAGAALIVGFVAVVAFTLAAPFVVALRPTFFLNALVTLGLWLALLFVAAAVAESRSHMREDAMIFLFPFMLILPALAVGGIAHYFVQRRHRTS